MISSASRERVIVRAVCVNLCTRTIFHAASAACCVTGELGWATPTVWQYRYRWAYAQGPNGNLHGFRIRTGYIAVNINVAATAQVPNRDIAL